MEGILPFWSLNIDLCYLLIISWSNGITRRLREKLVLPSSIPKDTSPSYTSLVHVLAWKSICEMVLPSSEASTPNTSTWPAFKWPTKVMPDDVHLKNCCPLKKCTYGYDLHEKLHKYKNNLCVLCIKKEKNWNLLRKLYKICTSQ